jgi:hypothetical protein
MYSTSSSIKSIPKLFPLNEEMVDVPSFSVGRAACSWHQSPLVGLNLDQALVMRPMEPAPLNNYEVRLEIGLGTRHEE